MRDEILALIEERPYDQQELAQVLSQSRDAVRHELRQLFQAGLVKRDADRWCLPSYAAPTVPAPKPISQETQVLEAVRAGHADAVAIAKVTGIPTKSVSAYLSILHTAGRIVHTGTVPSSGVRPMRVYALPRPQKATEFNESATKACRRCGQSMAAGRQENICPRCSGKGFATRGPRAERNLDEGLTFEELPRAVERVCPGVDCGKRFPADRAVLGKFCSTKCAETPRPSTVTRIIDGVTYEAESLGGKLISNWPETDIRSGSSLSGGSYQVKRS